MPADDCVMLSKMLFYCENSRKYARNISFEDFIGNELFLTFTVFSLSQLGELAAVLSKRTACCERYPELPWIAMRSMRNHIVHDYDGLQLNNIWSTVQEDIPALIEQLKDILSR